eukprot:scaffold17768_cov31-Tisochrysis_lutea.AAC.7
MRYAFRSRTTHMQILANSFEALERSMLMLDLYGNATGARVNRSKSILIRMGSLLGARIRLKR